MLSASEIRRMGTGRHTLPDAPGLALDVLPSGRRAWLYRRGNFRRRLGRWPAMSAKEALEKHAQISAALDRGEAVADALREAMRERERTPTVAEFGARYTKDVLEVDRKDPHQLIAMLRSEVYPVLGGREMCKVTGEDVRTMIFRKRDANRPAAAAALRNLLKRMWDYAIVCGVATSNPAHAVPLKFIYKTRTRSRTLSRAEVGAFLRGLYATGRMAREHKLALHLLLLTLTRKSELRLATWKEMDLDRGEWEIPAEHSKTGKPQIVYLSRQALDILRGLQRGAIDYEYERGQGGAKVNPEFYVFPGANGRTQPTSANVLNKALGRVRWGLPHFTIHDLRRTAATLLSEAGWAPDVIEKALNHTIKGVRGVYNRAEYGEQRRRMLQEWADMVDGWRVAE